ncbi:hypothetical protein ACOMHN_022729 [Nucella lapillus]
MCLVKTTASRAGDTQILRNLNPPTTLVLRQFLYHRKHSRRWKLCQRCLEDHGSRDGGTEALGEYISVTPNGQGLHGHSVPLVDGYSRVGEAGMFRKDPGTDAEEVGWGGVVWGTAAMDCHELRDGAKEGPAEVMVQQNVYRPAFGQSRQVGIETPA